MRVKGVIFLLVVVALGFLVSWISIDSYIESEVEYQASLANGALVEIDDLEVSLIDLKIRWNRLQITNPENTWENSFETGEAELDFLFWPALWERIIIEDVIFKNFKLDSERETDGYFEIPETEDAEPGFIASVIGEVSSEVTQSAKTEFTNIKADINVDSLMAEVNLQAPGKIDSLKNGLDQNYQKWDSTFANTNINQDISKIQQTMDAINTKDLKNPEKALEAIKNVQKLAKQTDSLKTQVQTIRTDFQEDFGESKGSVGLVDNWIQSDLDRALNLAKLPKIDAQNIAQSLFGEELLSNYAGYLEYIALAREYGGRLSGGEDEEKIERYKGKDYKFSDKYDWPKLWIQNIDVSGETKTAIQLAGTITNISSDQDKTGEPILFDISGQDDGSRIMELSGEFNYLGDEPTESVAFKYSGFDLAGTKLSPSALLPYPLVEGVGTVEAEVSIIDKRIESEVEYINSDLKFDFGDSQSDNRIQQLIKEAVSGADQISVSALIDNVDGPLKIKIGSNIDKLFVDALRSTVSKQVDEARQKVEQEVKDRIGDRKEEFFAFKDEKEAEIRGKYDQLEKKVNDQVERVKEKVAELEKRKKEIEDEIKKKAADALKKKIGF